MLLVVVVHQCTIVNVMGPLWELKQSKTIALLECWKQTRCFMEPFPILPHPGMDCGRFTHIMTFNKYMPLYYRSVGIESVLGVYEYRRGLNTRSLDE